MSYIYIVYKTEENVNSFKEGIFTMKSVFLCVATVMISVLLIPLGALKSETAVIKTSAKPETAETLTVKKAAKVYESFKVLIIKTQKIETVSAKDYLFGCVASEMPLSYSDEALKAQTVAAYTYACRKKQTSKNEYDLTDSPDTDQCYTPKADLLKKWGLDAENNSKRLNEIIDSVYGRVLTYDGSLALTCYHAISSGKTEDCENVWGKKLPYLISVDSSYDKLSENYLTTLTVTADEVKEKLSGLKNAEGEAENWFSSPVTTDALTVKSITFCNKTLTGFEVQKAFGLKSACFEVSYFEGNFIFTVKGSGHGVGMSQNGANYMAKQGSHFDEILLHYYPNCKIAE